MQQKWWYTIMHKKIIVGWFPNHLEKSWSQFGRLWTPESQGAGVACVELIRMPTTARVFPSVPRLPGPPKNLTFVVGQK
jgi:hypothetical protein